MSQPRYAAFYCEENVWWLAQDAQLATQDAEVVVITNARQKVVMWSQRAAKAPADAVGWDYHVVLATRGPRGREIWDLDCVLGAPLALDSWLDASFDERVPAAYGPRFRVAAAATFIARFASDRRHMRMPDGGWHVPPPPWPAIGGGTHDLDRWIDVDDETFGPAIDLRALRSQWG